MIQKKQEDAHLYKNNNEKDPHQQYCKKCSKNIRTAWAKKNKDRCKELRRNSQQKNKDSANKRYKGWVSNNRGRASEIRALCKSKTKLQKLTGLERSQIPKSLIELDLSIKAAKRELRNKTF